MLRFSAKKPNIRRGGSPNPYGGRGDPALRFRFVFCTFFLHEPLVFTFRLIQYVSLCAPTHVVHQSRACCLVHPLWAGSCGFPVDMASHKLKSSAAYGLTPSTVTVSALPSRISVKLHSPSLFPHALGATIVPSVPATS